MPLDFMLCTTLSCFPESTSVHIPQYPIATLTFCLEFLKFPSPLSQEPWHSGRGVPLDCQTERIVCTLVS